MTRYPCWYVRLILVDAMNRLTPLTLHCPLIIMLSSIQRVRALFTPSQAGYAPISTDPDASVEIDHEATRLAGRHQSPRDVYQCFWILGAGVLLPWNGKLEHCAEG